jgi:hypothetical protein
MAKNGRVLGKGVKLKTSVMESEEKRLQRKKRNIFFI